MHQKFRKTPVHRNLILKNTADLHIYSVFVITFTRTLPRKFVQSAEGSGKR